MVVMAVGAVVEEAVAAGVGAIAAVGAVEVEEAAAMAAAIAATDKPRRRFQPASCRTFSAVRVHPGPRFYLRAGFFW